MKTFILILSLVSIGTSFATNQMTSVISNHSISDWNYRLIHPNCVYTGKGGDSFDKSWHTLLQKTDNQITYVYRVVGSTSCDKDHQRDYVIAFSRYNIDGHQLTMPNIKLHAADANSVITCSTPLVSKVFKVQNALFVVNIRCGECDANTCNLELNEDPVP